MTLGAPGLSVVITSYNYGEFLPRAIQSVIDQQVEDLEIVIVDNRSTDDSWEIAQGFAASDPRIRAVRNAENMGLVGNHRRGLELARGTRIVFLSADDYLLPGHLQRAFAVHAAHPDVDLVFTTYFQVDRNERVISHLGHRGHLRGSYFGGRNEFAGLLTYDCYTCLPTTIFNRQDLIESGGFDDLLALDLDLYLRLAAAGKQMAFLDAPGVCIRVHSESASGRDRYVATGKQLLEHVTLLERYLHPKYEHLLSGHEQDVVRLLRAKINNVLQYPQGAQIVASAKPRIEDLTHRLREMLNASTAQTLSNPRISILLRVEDFNATADFLTRLQEQTYENWELIATTDAAYDIAPLLTDRTHRRAKLVNHRTPQSIATSLNDASRLAGGDIIVYGDAHVAWPQDHLSRIAAALSSAPVEAVTVPVALAIDGRENDGIAVFNEYYGGELAEHASRIGEAVPFVSLAHRRRLLDTTGPLEEALTHLVDVEFVQRALSHGPLGILYQHSITLHTRLDPPHPALLHPNDYIRDLQSIYQARAAGEPWDSLRATHIARLRAELLGLSATLDRSRAFFFTSVARGGSTPQKAKSHLRTRLLVIDDRVPYDELGRGYPRARAILADLRDADYDVTFYPLIDAYDEPPLDGGIPGIDILYGRGGDLLAMTLDETLDDYDVLWVSRPHNMRDVKSALQTIGRTPRALVYDAEAVYVERDRVRGAVEQKPMSTEKYASDLAKELSYTDGCSVVSAVSNGERELLASHFKGPIEIVRFSIASNPTPKSFKEREGLLFVGAIEADTPNDDALVWFMREVAPLAPHRIVRHAGVMKSERLPREPVTFLGVVPDLTPVYDDHRIFIAPTRFSAGLPQKVYEAAAHGLPSIVTPLLARQLGWTHERDVLVADSPEEWVASIERLYNDEELWQRLRNGALSRVEAEVSPAAFRAQVLRTVEIALATQKAAHG